MNNKDAVQTADAQAGLHLSCSQSLRRFSYLETQIILKVCKSFSSYILKQKDTSDFHGTVSFDPIKMSQQKIYQHVYQMSDTQKLVII